MGYKVYEQTKDFTPSVDKDAATKKYVDDEITTHDVANDHIDWTDASDNFKTSGGLTNTAEAVTAETGGIAISNIIQCTGLTTSGEQGLCDGTLANGTKGQIKIIWWETQADPGDTLKVTPASFFDGSIITFAAEGDSVVLVYSDTHGWILLVNNGCTVS